MSGADLAREIIRSRPNLPIVLTTGYNEGSDLVAAELKLPLLRKPYRLDALSDALATALATAGASLGRGTTPVVVESAQSRLVAAE